MSTAVPHGLPSYRDLPVVATAPPRSAWGLFGEDDQLGTVGLLSPERVVAAARLVGKGAVFPLNWALELPDPPILGRGRTEHTVVDLGPLVHPGTDDRYDNFYPQGSSQWDALSHIGHPTYGYYNGASVEQVLDRNSARNGIHNLARRGIVGRFVLLDLARHLQSQGRPIDCAASSAIDCVDLDATAAAQGLTIEPGDIVLLRFGWIKWYESAGARERDRIGVGGYFPAPGLSSDESTAEWLWDHHVAVIAADCPALESLPVDVATPDRFVHYRLVPLLGLTIGELLALDDLAADCASDGVYTGLFTAAPLNKWGGSGSPANALAVK